jgi:hypothetical protein
MTGRVEHVHEGELAALAQGQLARSVGWDVVIGG